MRGLARQRWFFGVWSEGCRWAIRLVCWSAIVGMEVAGVQAQQATSVQLPTVSYFGVGTSVLVPDRGGNRLGTLGQSASQMTQFGGPLPGLGQRGVSSVCSGQRAGISVWIHDFEAMEAQLLGQRQPVVAGPLSVKMAPKLYPIQQTDVLGPSDADRTGLSVAELRQLHQAELEAQNREAAMWLERAEKAQAEGKPAVARIYYQMALRRATGSLKQHLQQRLEALSASPWAGGRDTASPKR